MITKPLTTGSTSSAMDSAQATYAMQDKALMDKIAQGDRAAFESIATTYKPLIRCYLNRRIADPELVAEITNDVLLNIWQAAASYAGRAKLSSWVIGIARNCAGNALRGRRPNLVYCEPQRLDYVSQPLTTEQNRDSTLAESTDYAHLHQAVSALKLDHRTVIQLSFFQGRGYREIAGILGCPPNTVKTRMYHAKRHLQHLLRRAQASIPLAHGGLQLT